MEELKMLYIAPSAELLLFMPVEGLAYDDSWLRTTSDDDGASGGPGIDVGLGGDGSDIGGDGEEGPLG